MNLGYVIENDGEQTSIRCLTCNRISWNQNDIVNKYCGCCHKFHDEPTMPHVTPQGTNSQNPDREKKIIVALFLLLGKTLKALPPSIRENIQVTESEIRLAWSQQRSPVRVLSRVETSWALGMEQRIFQAVLEELDLQKTGMFTPGEKYPESAESLGEDPHTKETERRRVFDFD